MLLSDVFSCFVRCETYDRTSVRKILRKVYYVFVAKTDGLARKRQDILVAFEICDSRHGETGVKRCCCCLWRYTTAFDNQAFLRSRVLERTETSQSSTAIFCRNKADFSILSALSNTGHQWRDCCRQRPIVYPMSETNRKFNVPFWFNFVFCSSRYVVLRCVVKKI